jgi:ATP-dependent helicase HrpB
MPPQVDSPPPLPIHSLREQILQHLTRCNRLVICAPTGSGKTTQVPQFLHRSNLIAGQIVILQPRRLAARMMAARVAAEMNCALGGLVGYQTRHDSRIGDATIIRFMTEGLLLRLLQSDPNLRGIGAVIFDEFHERSLAGDIGIALVRRLQESARPDLRVLVMSATLDVQLVREYLDCPAVETHGRAYPVDVRYLPARPVPKVQTTVGRLSTRSLVPAWDLAAEALRDILDADQEGDVLIFMPGAYEIRRTIERCRALSSARRALAIFPLYSELSPAEQDAALVPADCRKVIVATNVAETSITIPGIRHVIDSGLARIHRFDPRRGINVLAVEPISQASADQRAGRAGRTAPGTCHRLWPQSEHRHRPAHPAPEIQRLDLAEVLIQLYDLGIGDPADFRWLTAPCGEALAQAQRTLEMLGAVDVSRPHELTQLGRTMARLPMHPRLSRMLVEAQQRGCLRRAVLWAALISERDVLAPGAAGRFAQEVSREFPATDLLVLEAAWELARDCGFDPARCEARGIRAGACRDVQRTQRLFLEALDDAGLRPSHHEDGAVEPLVKCLLVAFPDHLAHRRSDRNPACALTLGRRGALDPASVAQRAGLVLPIEISQIGQSDQSARTVLSLASEIAPQWLREVHPTLLRQERLTVYNPDNRAVEQVERTTFLDLVIEESISGEPPPSRAAELLAEQIVGGALRLRRWDEAVEQWIARTRCVARWFPQRGLLTYEPQDIRLIVEEICAGATRFSQVEDRPCLEAVKSALSWEDRQFVEQMAPQWLTLPGGRRMKIIYSDGAPPRGRARIQDLYGLEEAPTIAGGRLRLTLEILAPSNRPLQLTDDLPNFWKNLYPQLRKELARRYPKHKWL